MSPHATVHWAGETLHLLPSHALWWPSGQALLIADLHLGKATSYRALGQPVPGGTTRDAMRLPCFVSEHGQAILPAFGGFTGGHPMPAAPGRQLRTVGGDRVWAVPGV